MAAGGREPERDVARFVYVTRFGSYRCGGVLQLGSRRAQGRGSTGRGVGCSPEEPWAAAPAGAELAPRPRSRTPAASPPASRARSCPQPAARAALTQKNLAKKFDFPIPLKEASKVAKKKKKVSVWNRVYKVISRMLEENEKYRLRLKYQQLSCENSNYTR
ncbi:uncharacterized protein C5orf47-like [Enhydra lutris kenyoni]|uniref:Uncharacterized protein C5orf47-like n=1 Tax=Enhydra lutris kenyoni TaxID=391180 RepID=A0A2Y9IJ97_ENHLU|nr:uncharacterized protein C5orf47-like [Enhydra lutris kenyoni]XP_022348704.1 uncharacterized protein C5orf47-like [Enhydra lutris kenyoni]